MRAFVRFGVSVWCALMLVACDNDDSLAPQAAPQPVVVETIFDIATASGDFGTLLAAVDAAGLTSTLDDESAVLTVFAPTDAAFALLGEEAIEALLADPQALENVLLYHVISGAEVDAAAAKAAVGTTVEMANGDRIGVSAQGDFLFVNLSKVTATDIQADNGVIHVIDAVLQPPVEAVPSESTITNIAAADERFTTLVAALGATGLDTVLASETETFTVFAPTNEAFEAMGAANVAALLDEPENLTAILQQHVIADAAVDSVTAYSLSGGTATTVGGAEIPVAISKKRALRVGGAKVTVADIRAANGIIHVIDTVIVAGAGLPKPTLNVAEIAAAAGTFETLLAAVTTADLAGALTDPDKTYTVFAPTDEAFNELGADTIQGLLADPETLADILLYHIYEGEVLADAAIRIASSEQAIIEMANVADASTRSATAISLGNAGLTVNLASVTSANTMASNGVIHIIDKVMLPPTSKGDVTANVVDTAVAAGSFTTLVSALEVAGLVEVLSRESAEITVFAPTDAAFDALDPDTLSALLADGDALTALLKTHIISTAEVDSVTAYALNGSSVRTASGSEVTLKVEEGALRVQNATVTAGDIYTTNGIIHVIDKVISVP